MRAKIAHGLNFTGMPRRNFPRMFLFTYQKFVTAPITLCDPVVRTVAKVPLTVKTDVNRERVPPWSIYASFFRQ